MKRYLPFVALTIGFIILSVPLWIKIDLLPIRMWDESRNAVNALEMYFSHDWLVRTYHNSPETYNLKPPLLTWLQVGSIHLFGINELAIRIPSLIAAIGSMFFVYFLVFQVTRSQSFGFLASGIMVTSSGYYGTHVARYGDHDALLVFFVLSLIYGVYRYAITSDTRYVYMMAISICLGVLAKSITILIFLPGILLFFLLDRKVLQLLKSKHTYFAAVLCILPILGYYIAREHVQPGYWSFVWNDELFPRYFNTSENIVFEKHTFSYYFELLFFEHMSYWLWFSPLIVFSLFLKNISKTGWLLLLSTSLSYLIIISKGTKNFWYDAPAIPLIAALLAVSAYLIFRKISIRHKWVIPLLTIAVLIVPYKEAHTKTLHSAEQYFEWETNGISHYLKNDKHCSHLSSNTKILLDSMYGFEPHLFYLKKLEAEKGIKIDRIWHRSVRLGDTLLISHLNVYNTLKGDYDVHVIDSSYSHTKLIWLKEKE